MLIKSLNFKLVTNADWPELQVLYQHLQPKDPVVTDGSDHQTFLEIIQSEHFFLVRKTMISDVLILRRRQSCCARNADNLVMKIC